MKIPKVALIGAFTILPLAGCASRPSVLNSVGPEPLAGSAAAFNQDGFGNLRVYTATETREVGDNTFYYPHTGYTIYTKSGRLWKYVPNHTFREDEVPAWVSIPAGKYTIKAKSDLYSLALVPVVIQEGRTTVVHLESGWRPPAIDSRELVVHLPNGEAVGWGSQKAN